MTYYVKMQQGTKRPITEWRELSNCPTIQPEGTYGLLTGVSNGIMVVDCDVKHADKPNGIMEYDKLMRELNVQEDYKDTFTVVSPSGGLHYYYTLPCPLPTFHDDSRSIDFQADNALVVGHRSPMYTVIHNVQPREIPTELFAWLKAREDIQEHFGKREKASFVMRDFFRLLTDLKYTNYPDGMATDFAKWVTTPDEEFAECLYQLTGKRVTIGEYEQRAELDALGEYTGVSFIVHEFSKPKVSSMRNVYMANYICSRLVAGTNDPIELTEWLYMIADARLVGKLDDNEIPAMAKQAVRKFWKGDSK